jgi:excisionase family DNA binding protein
MVAENEVAAELKRRFKVPSVPPPPDVTLGDKAPEAQLQSENRLAGRSGDKKPRPPPLPPDVAIAYRVNDAARVSGLSRSSIYELIGEGKLRSIMVAGRRLIPTDALRELLQGAA